MLTFEKNKKMAVFEIKKTIYTTTVVKCSSKQKAKKLAEKIVATIEVEDDKIIPRYIDSFEADVVMKEIIITEIESNL